MKKKQIYFLPLGGSGEIGMNMNLYAYEDQWLMVDCGITFEHDLGIDVITPDPTFVLNKKLVGIVCTHAHEDHVGALPYLYQKFTDCPLYATPFTMGVVKRKLQDVGKLNPDFLHTVQLKERFSIAPFDLEFITLTHSIPEPNGLVIRTPAGVIFHTGDWKIDMEPLIGAPIDGNRLTEIGKEGVLSLVCDSTNAGLAGRSGSERSVRKSLTQLIQGKKGRVVAACFASNVVRLESIILAAQQNGRCVALVGRSLNRIVDIARETGYLKNLKPFVKIEEAMKQPNAQVMLICTGSQGESKAALTRIAAKTHPKVRLSAGDAVIFSSRMIPGNEVSIHHLQRQLESQGIEIITDEDALTHVSGHPNQEDLKDMYRWVQPASLIPVHGEYRHMRAHAQWGEKNGIPHTYVPYNGQLICLEKGKKPQLVKEVETGRLALDGQDLVPLSSTHLEERSTLKEGGVCFITLIIGSKSQLLSAPEVTCFGLTHKEKLGDTIKEVIDEILEEPFQDNVKIRALVMRHVRQIVGSYTGKKPLISVHIARIKGKK